MPNNAVPNSITSKTNMVDYLVLNVGELMKDRNCDVCVYCVLKSLSYTKPEAFTPQFVGLGLYHHRGAEDCFFNLKVAAILRVLKDIHVLTKLVEELRNLKLVPLIRNSYAHDSSIEFRNDDTVLNLMTVDALFLYDLLRSLIIIEEEKDATAVTKFDLQDSILTGKQGMPLVSAAGVELSKDAIIRDAFMLENQIPSNILKQIITVITFTSIETEPHANVDEVVGSKMLDFCRALCPLLKIEQVSNKSEAVKRVHLLDLMYHLIVPEPETKPESESQHQHQPEPEPETRPESESQREHQPEPVSKPETGVEAEDEKNRLLIFYAIPLWVVVCIVYIVIIILVIIFWALGKILGLLKQLAISSIPVLEKLHETLNAFEPLQPFAKLVGVIKDACNLLKKSSTNPDIGARQAVTIPSVTKLHNAGIHFQPAKGGISSIKFVEEKSTFYLPRIRVDVNSEVIIRNLLAYELLTKSDCLIFTSYVELMRTIIDTAEDVKLLVNEEIIQTELSDEQIAQLFNGISKSIRPTKIPELEEEIKKVNAKYTNGQRLKRFMTNCVYSSGSLLAVVAALGLLVLMALQTYCSSYGCSGTSKYGKLPEEGVEYRNNYFISSM